MAKWLLVLCVLATSVSSQASVLGDVEGVRLLNASLLASLIPKNLFPGETKIHYIGVEFGLLVGGFGSSTLKTALESLPGLESSANDVGKYTLLPQLPSLYTQLAFPFGLAVDAQFLPPLTFTSVSEHYWAGGLKWNYLAALMPSSKLDSSIRLNYHNFGIQKGTNYSIGNTGYGVLHTFGKRFSWASLWLGYGFATGSMDFKYSSTKVSISESPRVSGLHVSVGGVLEGGGFVTGLEWANIVGVNTATLKFGLRI